MCDFLTYHLTLGKVNGGQNANHSEVTHTFSVVLTVEVTKRGRLAEYCEVEILLGKLMRVNLGGHYWGQNSIGKT